MTRSGYWVGALLAFLAELASLAALAYWGATVPAGTGPRVAAAAGLPLAAVVAAAVVFGHLLTSREKRPAAR